MTRMGRIGYRRDMPQPAAIHELPRWAQLTRGFTPINSRGSGSCASTAHDAASIIRRTARRLLWARSIVARDALQCSGALPAKTLGVDAPEKQRRTIERPMLFGDGRAMGPLSCCSGECTRRWRMDTGPDAGRRSTRVFAGWRTGQGQGLALRSLNSEYATNYTARALSKYRHHGAHRCR